MDRKNAPEMRYFPFGSFMLALVFIWATSSADWQRAAGISSRLNCLYSDGQYVFAGTNGAAYRSSNNGTSWAKIDTGMGYRYVYAFIVHKGFLFSATDTGIFRGTNNGQRWTFSGPRSGIYDLAQDTGAIFGADAGVYRSSDGGTGWTAVNSGLAGEFVWCVDVKGTYAFCGTSNSLYRSPSRGNGWGKLSGGGIPTVQFNDIMLEGSNLFFASSGGLFRSSDNGSNWVFSGPVSGPTWSILSYGGLMFIAMDAGVYFSADHGLTWTATGLTGTNLMHLAACRDTLFAGFDYSGIWRRPIAEIDGSVLVDNKSLEKKQSANQAIAYLRLDGMADIRFSLDAASLVHISIFNNHGALVGSPMIKQFPSGHQSAILDISGKSPGIYWCRMHIGVSDFCLPLISHGR